MINLTTDSLITLIGTIVTVISMIVAIKQASNAKKYREQIKFDIRKIDLAKCTEQIIKALEDSRRLPISYNNISKGTYRGTNILNLIESINTQLDHSIGVLNEIGKDNDIRKSLVNAQKKLHKYEVNYHKEEIEADDVQELRGYIQNSISSLNARLYQIEKK